MCVLFFFFFKQKTAYEMRISDWSSDVCSSDLRLILGVREFSSTCRARRAFCRPPLALAMKPLRGSGRDSCGISAAAARTAHRRRGPRAPTRFPSYPMTSRLPRDPDPCPAPDVATDASDARLDPRSEEHTSDLQSHMHISYAVFCLNKKNKHN